jgi:hypothetical protein
LAGKSGISVRSTQNDGNPVIQAVYSSRTGLPLFCVLRTEIPLFFCQDKIVVFQSYANRKYGNLGFWSLFDGILVICRIKNRHNAFFDSSSIQLEKALVFGFCEP